MARIDTPVPCGILPPEIMKTKKQRQNQKPPQLTAFQWALIAGLSAFAEALVSHTKAKACPPGERQRTERSLSE
jgi:hypothetical protein